MKRFGRVLAGFGFAALCGALLAAAPAEEGSKAPSKLGVGPAYEQMGRIAVMHQGRVKPLDTVAREEIKQIFGRETIKILDDSNRVVETWSATGAFADWLARPEYWNDQPFILIDYQPLKREILRDSVQTQLKAIAGKEGTSDEDREGLEALVENKQIDASAINAYLKTSQLDEADKAALAATAAKLSEERKWLSPNELDAAKVVHGDHMEGFMDWAAKLDAQKRKFDANPNSAPRPTEIERRAIEAGQRLLTYQSYTSEEMRSAGLVRIMPRPSTREALDYYKEVIPKARSVDSLRDLTPVEFDTLKALDTYWNDTPKEDRHEPGENAEFDKKFASWLDANSVWTPLKVFLQDEPEALAKAGFPEAETKAFLEAYEAFVNNEKNYPGELPRDVADALLAASRTLGEKISPEHYPTVAAMDRETHFNAMNPFWQAPFAYGASLVLLMVSLGFSGGRVKEMSAMGKGFYWAGMLGLFAGIGLEVYGFYLRVMITGWAPVTNMYETVIWVALVTAVLAVVFELMYHRTYTGVAGAAVALLGTLTAANVPLLDPSIKSLQPVLRSNMWLLIHVITEVSSYAAFGLAWALGLIATFYYLTATYRRSPSFGELALPLVPGLPLLAVGGVGMAASYGAFGDAWLTTDALFYVFSIMGGLGGMITLGVALAFAGEAANRLTSPAIALEAQSKTAAEDPFHTHQGPMTTAEKIQAAATTPAPAAASAREQSMRETAALIKPLANFIYRSMQVGVLLIAAGTILGGVWADYSWGRFWGWDPKEVWALITLLVYLVPLHGRFAGWVNTFTLVFASVACFLSVIMAWYGVNFVLGVGLHSYGFVDGGSQGSMSIILASIMALPLAAMWRRMLGHRPMAHVA